jgi:hypothetical protein
MLPNHKTDVNLSYRKQVIFAVKHAYVLIVYLYSLMTARK